MKTVLLLALMSLFTSAFAGSAQMLAGVEFGQSKSSWGSFTGRQEDNLGLRVGIETKESRIYGSYNHVLAKDLVLTGVDFENHIGLLNLEAKTKPLYHVFRAFIGGHFGLIYSNLRNKSINLDETDTNFIYGAQGGVLIDITKNISLEAAYKYSWTNAGTNSNNPDDIGTYYGALNIKF